MASADVAVFVKSNPRVQASVEVALALKWQLPIPMPPPSVTDTGVEGEGMAATDAKESRGHEDRASVWVHDVGAYPLVVAEGRRQDASP